MQIPWKQTEVKIKDIKIWRDITGKMQKMQKKRAISLFSTVAPAMILYPMDDTSLSLKFYVR